MTDSDESLDLNYDQKLQTPSQTAEEPSCFDDMDGTYQRLAPQYVTFDRRTSYLSSMVVGGLAVAASSPAIVYAVTTNQWWLTLLIPISWFLLGVLLAAASHFWPPIKYRHTSWRLGADGMEIRRGVLWRHRIAVPITRVQHVDVSQGPIQRMFELGTLTIYTAGTKHSAVEIEGLEHDLALNIRNQLIAQKESLDVT